MEHHLPCLSLCDYPYKTRFVFLLMHLVFEWKSNITHFLSNIQKFSYLGSKILKIYFFESNLYHILTSCFLMFIRHSYQKNIYFVLHVSYWIILCGARCWVKTKMKSIWSVWILILHTFCNHWYSAATVIMIIITVIIHLYLLIVLVPITCQCKNFLSVCLFVILHID